MLLTETFDLDLEDVQELFINAKETIAYLSDLCNSVEKRVMKGEEIEGFEIVSGKKRRVITAQGIKYLEATFGKDEVYKKSEKFIGIGDLEKLVSTEEMVELHNKGVLAFKAGSSKVIVKKIK